MQSSESLLHVRADDYPERVPSSFDRIGDAIVKNELTSEMPLFDAIPATL